MSLKSYVIFSEDEIEISQSFIEKYHTFTPIPAFSQAQLDIIGDKNILFNTEKAEKQLKRNITDKEIIRTLSHIKCWKTIAENNAIRDNDFVLISESDVELANNYLQRTEEYIHRYYHYGIIKLQRDGEETLIQQEDIIDAIVYRDHHHYNHGASLYLIRKSIAKKLVDKLHEIKPYWLADQWTLFYDAENIAQSKYFIGRKTSTQLQNKLENPLFSIIIPIYNVEKYLKLCIDSVLAQDFSNYEIILVDDGSPDNSLDICVHYAKKYKNIFLLHKQNGGLSDARNKGIDIARGEYLIFIDSDDYWNGTNILSDLDHLIKEHNHPDLIINYMSSVYPDRVVHHAPPIRNISGNFHHEYSYLAEKGIFVGFTFTKILKRKLVKNHQLYFIKDRYFEDMPWSFSLIRHINDYVIYPNPFYMYRRDREGAISKYVSTKNQESLFKNFDDIYSEMISIITAKPTLSAAIRRSVEGMHHYTMHCYELLNTSQKESLHEMKEDYLKKFQQAMDYIDKRKNELANDWLSLISTKEKERFW